MHIIIHYNYIPFVRITQVTMLQKTYAFLSKSLICRRFRSFFTSSFHLNYQLIQFFLTFVHISSQFYKYFHFYSQKLLFWVYLPTNLHVCPICAIYCTILHLLECFSFVWGSSINAIPQNLRFTCCYIFCHSAILKVLRCPAHHIQNPHCTVF